MKRIYKVLIIWLTVEVIAGACTTDFEEINTNPNATENITNPGLLLPNIIRSGADNLWNSSWDRGAVLADQLAVQYASCFTNLFRSDAPGYFLWNYYSVNRDLSTAIKISEEMGYATFTDLFHTARQAGPLKVLTIPNMILRKKYTRAFLQILKRRVICWGPQLRWLMEIFFIAGVSGNGECSQTPFA